jgi:N-methylhydantoinase A/oxoprolinase/acetone carboxylase beta subunit
MKRIGIDVGGTNTDAVLLDGKRVVAGVKAPTTADVMSGVIASLQKLKTAAPQALDVSAIMIGTTHFTNAVVERRNLMRVGVIRICLPTCASLEPLCDWPDDLRAAVDPMSFLVAGGTEYDGRDIVPLDEGAIREAAMRIRDAGIRAVAITAVFSPLRNDFELRAKEIVEEICKGIFITCSHEVGRIGLLERENVTVLNACLGRHGFETVRAFKNALWVAGIDAPFYLTQNDGTVLQADTAARFPVFSFASGPTNSMRGAAFLSGIEDGVVCDVGGTTSDIGYLVKGFPREANSVVNIGGVRTLFRMPDLVSLGIGGGSLIAKKGPKVGPESVGFRLPQSALVFGGNTLTMTDIGVAAGMMDIGDRSLVSHLDRTLVQAVLKSVKERLEDAVDQMKTSPEDVELIAVGGGAPLIPEIMEGVSRVVHCEHGGVANAVGAASAMISGEVDQIASGVDRDKALADAEELARLRAIEGGADETTLTIVDIEDVPIAYLPGNARRVRVRVVGEIAGWQPQTDAAE